MLDTILRPINCYVNVKPLSKIRVVLLFSFCLVFCPFYFVRPRRFSESFLASSRLVFTRRSEAVGAIAGATTKQ